MSDIELMEAAANCAAKQVAMAYLLHANQEQINQLLADLDTPWI